MNGVILAAAITLLGQTPTQPTRWVYRTPQRHVTRQRPVTYQTAQRVVYSTPTYSYQQTTTVSPTVYQQTTQVQYYGTDSYGFLAWLNATRAQYGLRAVGYDTTLEAWAHTNNAHQAIRGLGHFVMGPARRQNSAMSGSVPSNMWMASPGHQSALLDPTITRIGIAFNGSFWTFNAS